MYYHFHSEIILVFVSPSGVIPQKLINYSFGLDNGMDAYICAVLHEQTCTTFLSRHACVAVPVKTHAITYSIRESGAAPQCSIIRVSLQPRRSLVRSRQPIRDNVSQIHSATSQRRRLHIYTVAGGNRRELSFLIGSSDAGMTMWESVIKQFWCLHSFENQGTVFGEGHTLLGVHFCNMLYEWALVAFEQNLTKSLPIHSAVIRDIYILCLETALRHVLLSHIFAKTKFGARWGSLDFWRPWIQSHAHVTRSFGSTISQCLLVIVAQFHCINTMRVVNSGCGCKRRSFIQPFKKHGAASQEWSERREQKGDATFSSRREELQT